MYMCLHVNRKPLHARMQFPSRGSLLDPMQVPASPARKAGKKGRGKGKGKATRVPVDEEAEDAYDSAEEPGRESEPSESASHQTKAPPPPRRMSLNQKVVGISSCIDNIFGVHKQAEEFVGLFLL